MSSTLPQLGRDDEDSTLETVVWETPVWRASVRSEDLEWWLSRQLRDLAAVASGGRPPSRALRDTVRRFNPELGNG